MAAVVCVPSWFGHASHRTRSNDKTHPHHQPPKHAHTNPISFRFSLELADNDASTAEAAERGDVTLQKRFRVNGVVYYYPYANYKVQTNVSLTTPQHQRPSCIRVSFFHEPTPPDVALPFFHHPLPPTHTYHRSRAPPATTWRRRTSASSAARRTPRPPGPAASTAGCRTRRRRRAPS